MSGIHERYANELGTVHQRSAAESAAEQDRDTATQRRQAAVAAFARPAAAGLLELAVGDAAPPDHAEAARWPLTRALEVARALPAELLTVRSSAGELAQEVLRRVALLDRERADADMGAHASQDADGLVLVHVSEGPGARGLAEVLDALDGEIAERERVLSAEERRVFNDALVEELAEHLRLRIYGVRSSVASVNAVLRSAPTAGGKIVQLEWRALDDETRERVLGATAVFDLDLVMTSHELWGTYHTVRQLSVYQLHREQGDFGVHAIRFLWDGDRLRELEQDQLDLA